MQDLSDAITPELWGKASKAVKEFGEAMPCLECKDGYYYPLVGPREPCQSCQRSRSATLAVPQDFDYRAYVQGVCNRVVSLLDRRLVVKSMKHPNRGWDTCVTGVKIFYLLNRAQVASQFDSEIEYVLNKYGYAATQIAFDKNITTLPPDTDSQKHVFTISNGDAVTMSLYRLSNN